MEETRQWRRVGGMSERKFANFEHPGDALEGTIKGYREITTVHGRAQIVDIDAVDDHYSLIISAGLQPLMEMSAGAYVRVVYQGVKLNPKTKRNFKDFEILVDTDTYTPF